MRRLFLGAAIAIAPVALGVSTAQASPTTTTTSSSSTYVAPLTGLPDPHGVTKKRAALTIKIDNTPEAHAQTGIDKADVVYEEIVEGGITRLAAIFNSQLPTVVGPVRSVRKTDREIVDPIGGIFAFSGGAAYAIRSIETAPVLLFQQSNAGSAMFRNPRRPAPHNLYANAAALSAKGGKPKPPPALFTYRSASAATPGVAVSSFTVGFGAGFETTYTWSSKTKSWNRSIFGAPDIDTDGVRISPKNVIVMSVNYQGGVGVEQSQATLTGSGQVYIFTGGHVQTGKWSRTNLFKPIAYTNSNGVMTLVPGQTFVELMATSQHVSITLKKK